MSLVYAQTPDAALLLAVQNEQRERAECARRATTQPAVIDLEDAQGQLLRLEGERDGFAREARRINEARQPVGAELVLSLANAEKAAVRKRQEMEELAVVAARAITADREEKAARKREADLIRAAKVQEGAEKAREAAGRADIAIAALTQALADLQGATGALERIEGIRTTAFNNPSRWLQTALGRDLGRALDLTGNWANGGTSVTASLATAIARSN
ncbi:hypothetical protein [Acidomonas methanolica]|uniref:hypothetical protein n=1 Tax=Acidomonas methanolica TaxID=437 RepID=UPI00211A9B35|nr:hypothetical protein [Acidomonas methanolica]MCQ9156801.1 hypothetical protein [Acidomonas methanolica]